jgi:hypothetical protein
MNKCSHKHTIGGSTLEDYSQGWKCMAVANTLPYYDMQTITAVICLKVQVPDLFVQIHGSSFPS